MKTLKFTYWKSKTHYIGFLNDYSDNWTQGDDLEDLKEHLQDLYEGFLDGTYAEMRQEGVLEVA